MVKGIDIAQQVHSALCNFERAYNIHPNRIILGDYLARALVTDFRHGDIRVDNINAVLMEFEGIRVEINKTDRTALSVGYIEETII